MSTHNIPFSACKKKKKKNTINCPKSTPVGYFSLELKNEFETAVVNEPSVFEPLKFYCIFLFILSCVFLYCFLFQRNNLSVLFFFNFLKLGHVTACFCMEVNKIP